MPQQSPIPDEVDGPFWAACNLDRLVFQFCSSCEQFRFPPSNECWVCGSTALSWREVTPDGLLYSFAVIRDTPVALLKQDLPYVVGVVELDGADGVNLVAQLRDVAVDDVAMDARVVISFEPTPGTGQKVPVARLAEAIRQEGA